MTLRFVLPCVGAALLASSLMTHAQIAANPPVSAPAVKPPPAISSQAVADFYRRHQTAKTLSFTATYYASSTEALGFLQMNTYTVQAKRPNLFAVRGNPAILRVVTEGDQEHSEFLSNLLNVSISDGRTMLQFDTRTRAYEKSPAPAGFPGGPGALQSVKPQAALNADMLDGFVPAPNEEVWRRPTLVFAQTYRDNPRGLEVEKLYFATDTGELLRYSMFFQYKFQGPMRENERVEYSDWKFDVRLPRSAFALTLPANAIPMPPVRARPLAALRQISPERTP